MSHTNCTTFQDSRTVPTTKKLHNARTPCDDNGDIEKQKTSLFDQFPLTLLGTALALAGGKVVRTEGRHTKGYKAHK